MSETRIKEGERVSWCDAAGRFRRGVVERWYPNVGTYDCHVLDGWRDGLAPRQTRQEVTAAHLHDSNPDAPRVPMQEEPADDE